jgi:hypothetical protein
MKTATVLIKTQNSIYEIDKKNKKIRRLDVSEEKYETVFTNSNGEWKDYDDISSIKIGSPLLVIFYDNKKVTRLQTSNLMEILEAPNVEAFN